MGIAEKLRIDEECKLYKIAVKNNTNKIKTQ